MPHSVTKSTAVAVSVGAWQVIFPFRAQVHVKPEGWGHERAVSTQNTSLMVMSGSSAGQVRVLIRDGPTHKHCINGLSGVFMVHVWILLAPHLHSYALDPQHAAPQPKLSVHESPLTGYPVAGQPGMSEALVGMGGIRSTILGSFSVSIHEHGTFGPGTKPVFPQLS